MTEVLAEAAEATVWDVLRELIAHSTLGGSDKDRLSRSVNVLDPAVDDADIPAIPETPEQELTRLRAEAAARPAESAWAPGSLASAGQRPANPGEPSRLFTPVT